MALCTSNIATVVVAATSMIWMQLLLLLIISGASGVDSFECTEGLVYPYWSMCWRPAVYEYDGGVYELESVSRESAGSRLAPEWDEANSTYYVRLAEVGAKYGFTHLSYERRPWVAQSHNFLIQNVETGRFLGWRQEGEDEWFLVEGGGDNFQFSRDENVTLACPPILGVRCEAYSILSRFTSLGLSAYEEDGATYFKLSQSASDDLFPFVLRRSSTSSSSALGIAAAA